MAAALPPQPCLPNRSEQQPGTRPPHPCRPDPNPPSPHLCPPPSFPLPVLIATRLNSALFPAHLPCTPPSHHDPPAPGDRFWCPRLPSSEMCSSLSRVPALLSRPSQWGDLCIRLRLRLRNQGVWPVRGAHRRGNVRFIYPRSRVVRVGGGPSSEFLLAVLGGGGEQRPYCLWGAQRTRKR